MRRKKATSAKSGEKNVFVPAKFPGVLLLSGLLICLAGLIAVCAYSMVGMKPGVLFFISLTGTAFLVVPLILIGYRLYSLLSGAYILERNSLTIIWGLRKEVIPLNAIEWARNPSEMPYEIPWTFLPMPGAYSGKRNTDDYGQMEFMASSVPKMLFIGSSRCIYGISPKNPDQFLNAFEKMLQLGMLSEREWESVRTTDWFTEAWSDPIARKTTLISGVLLILLLFWVNIRIPGFTVIKMRFSAAGISQDQVSANSLMLIPLLAGINWLINIFLGIRLFSSEDRKITAELLWRGNVLIVLAYFIGGVLITLQPG